MFVRFGCAGAGIGLGAIFNVAKGGGKQQFVTFALQNRNPFVFSQKRNIPVTQSKHCPPRVACGDGKNRGNRAVFPSG
jgi:hypothetical protein